MDSNLFNLSKSFLLEPEPISLSPFLSYTLGSSLVATNPFRSSRVFAQNFFLDHLHLVSITSLRLEVGPKYNISLGYALLSCSESTTWFYPFQPGVEPRKQGLLTLGSSRESPLQLIVAPVVGFGL